MNVSDVSAECHGLTGRSDVLHVLFVVDQLPRVLGGGELALIRMIRGLPPSRFRCSLLVLATPEHDLSGILAGVHVYPMTSAYNLRAVGYARRLARLIHREGIDAVVTFFESSDLWAGTVAKCFTSAKVIWSRRDLGILRGPKHKIAYRLLRKLPDRVIAVSEQVRQHCVREDGIDPAIIRTVYNGTEILVHVPFSRRIMRQRFGIPEAAMWVVCTANVRRVKGLDVLLEAVHRIASRHPEIVCTVVGGVKEADYMEELQSRVRELGLESQFRFTGESSEVPEILAAADIFVLPSRSEGFSNALIEAMAAGLPSVATAIGGNIEALRDGKTGILVATESADALASGLHALLADPDRAQQMGLAARMDAEERFSNRQMVERLAGVLEEVCGIKANC